MTELKVADPTGFSKGSRIQVGDSETLVITNIDGSTFSTRKYYFFDKWYDSFILWWIDWRYR